MLAEPGQRAEQSFAPAAARVQWACGIPPDRESTPRERRTRAPCRRLRGMLPRIVFVLGKGGVGRSTVSAALGLHLARAGERVLVLEWALGDAIAPWFGLPPAGVDPVEVAPRLSVANFRLDAALRAYFVDHLRLRRVYHHIIDGPQVRRLIAAAPGISELLFLGQLWWLTSLAEQEAGLCFDRIVVDAPATGHGSSLLELPQTLSALGLSALLALEVGRVRAMMADPAWTGALLVALPDELSLEETRALLPRATRALGRAPLFAFVNRSASRCFGHGASGCDPLAQRLSPSSHAALGMLEAELRARTHYEAALLGALEGATALGAGSLDEQLMLDDDGSPLAVVRALADPVGARLRSPR